VERPALLHRLQSELVRDPMVLDKPPLLRARLVRFDPENRVLLLAVEHLVFDGWSTGIAISGMASALGGTRPQACRLQYADWAAWQRRHLSGAALDRLTRYWRSQLAGTQPFAPPKMPPPASALESRRRVVSMVFPAEMVTELRSTGRATGVTMFMLTLTAAVAAWHQCSGDADFIMYTSTANRSRPETAEIIGWLAHAVLLRFKLDDNATWQVYLTAVRKCVLEALLYQDLTLPLLVKALQPDQHGSPRPGRLFFNFEPPLAPVYEIPAGVLRQLYIESPETVAYPGLSLNVAETEDGGLALRIVFDQAEVDDAFVQDLAGKIGRGLRELADNGSPDGIRGGAATGMTTKEG
jgi:hypothetical protein